jgi:hypothetical protein
MDETDATLDGNWIPPEKVWPGARNDSLSNCVRKEIQHVGHLPSGPSQSGPIRRLGLVHRGENRTTNAPWEIVFKGGKATVPVNQTINGGKWFLLTSDKEFDRERMVMSV